MCYTHLILCTGTDGPFPGKFNALSSYETAIEQYDNFVKEVLWLRVLHEKALAYCLSGIHSQISKMQEHIHICVHCFQIQLAETVLVVGGGSTGVEMAAEVKTEYPDKKVNSRPT